MTIWPDHRIAAHALGNRVASATSVRRWAVVRLILGFLQMFGAVFSAGLIVHSGITPLALAGVIITGAFTGTSMLLFQVYKRGESPNGQIPRDDRTR